MRVAGRAAVELVLAVVSAVGAGWSWVQARTTVVVPPLIKDEPTTTSVIYDPPLLVLMLLLTALAGVLAVLAIARLRRRG